MLYYLLENLCEFFDNFRKQKQQTKRLDMINPQEEATRFVRTIRMMVETAFPFRANALMGLKVVNMGDAVTMFEQEGPAFAAYDPFQHLVFAEDTFMSIIGGLALKGEQATNHGSYPMVLWTLAHEMMHAASFRKVIKCPKGMGDGEYEVINGVSTLTATLHNGQPLGRHAKLEVFNELLTNHFALIAMRNGHREQPDIIHRLNAHYHEVFIDVDIQIARRLTKMAGENALVDAYFNGKTNKLARGLASHKISFETLCELMGDRGHPERVERCKEAIRMLGLTPSDTGWSIVG
jgi:hypothetical protein